MNMTEQDRELINRVRDVIFETLDLEVVDATETEPRQIIWMNLTEAAEAAIAVARTQAAPVVDEGAVAAAMQAFNRFADDTPEGDFNAMRAALEAALNPSQVVEQVGPCMWCGNAILPGQPTSMVDGDRLHLHCAAEEADNATFDRDMGFD